MTRTKSLIATVLVAALILLVPLLAMQVTDEVAWDLADFAVAWALMSGAGLAYIVATRQAGNPAYRAAVGVSLATAFILVWINLAVGILGNEDILTSLLYGGVLAIGLIGAIVARFRPEGMARALFATALAQVFVTVVAIITSKAQASPDPVRVLGLNTCFVVLFAGSALLFRRAARQAESGGADQSATLAEAKAE